MRAPLSIAALLLLTLLAAQRGQAQSLYNSGGFELPRFLIQKPLEGQDLLNPWQKDGGTSTAVVQTNQSADPLPQFQSVLVTRAAESTGDTRWWVAAPSTPGGGAIVNIDFDLNVNVAPVLTTSGPLFGMQAFDTSSGTAKSIGGVFLDAAQGRLLKADTGTGTLSPTGQFLSRDVYHHVTLSLDFDGDHYTILIDGQPVQTESFVDANIATFSFAAITVLAGDSQTQTGKAYFDNYAISQVPEPTPGVLATISVVGFILRRRNKASQFDADKSQSSE